MWTVGPFIIATVGAVFAVCVIILRLIGLRQQHRAHRADLAAIDARFMRAMKGIMDTALRDLGPEYTSRLAARWIGEDPEVAPGYYDLLRGYLVEGDTDG